jgi:hypothetical protein
MKTWQTILVLAAALGVSDARAANVEWEAAMRSCAKVIDNIDICLMHTAATEEVAQMFRRSSMWACAQATTGDGAATDKVWCAEIRGYILGRWGY